MALYEFRVTYTRWVRFEGCVIIDAASEEHARELAGIANIDGAISFDEVDSDGLNGPNYDLMSVSEDDLVAST